MTKITSTFASRQTLGVKAAHVALLGALIACFTPDVVANDLPTVNLGATSFLDGAPPSGPGLYFTQYLQRYSSHRLLDQAGNRVPLPRTDLRFDVSLTQFAYLTNQDILGGKLAFDFVLPWVVDKRVNDGLNNAVLNADRGVGDLTFGPAIQWAPVMGPRGPRYAHRVEFQFLLPTGSYDRLKAINPGSNFWSFNPYWAGTVWMSPNWTTSWRLHYLWNGKNTDPGPSYGPGATSVQAGQAVHANFTTEYALTPQFRLGINGYWLNQITDTKINGRDVSGRREKVWAIGPGAVFSLSPHDHLFLNAYFEQDAENRPEGKRMQLRWVHHFK